MFSSLSDFAVKACIAIGTFCMLSLRRWAVTMISPSESWEASAGSPSASGDIPTETPPSTAAITHDSFEFITSLP